MCYVFNNNRQSEHVTIQQTKYTGQPSLASEMGGFESHFQESKVILRHLFQYLSVKQSILHYYILII